MASGIQVIGDEIHFDGELVAIMTTNGSATLRGAFCDWLDEAMPPEPEKDEPAPVDDDTILDALWSKAIDTAKGGLLRMGELANIITRLKEDKPE